MDIEKESQKIYTRFWNATEAALGEVKADKLKAAEFFLFDPTGKDLVKAAELLGEIGF